jgi:thymidylate kinase
MLDTVRLLFERFDQEGIFSCHWKSNNNLEAALDGEGDLDLLFEKERVPAVEKILASCGMIRAITRTEKQNSWIRHYYGYDDKSMRIVHVHAYFSLITGGAVLKNYHFPLEEKILNGFNKLWGVSIPDTADEYILFVVRKMLESSSFIEVFMMQREYVHILKELEWFQQRILLTEHLEETRLELFPEISKGLWENSVDALRRPNAWLQRWRLGRQFRQKLQQYAIHNQCVAFFQRIEIFTRKCIERISGNMKCVPFRGGLVIAVVGLDASGKSSTVRWLTEWLGECFDVRTIHSGKPIASKLTLIPRLFRSMLRYLYYNDQNGECDQRRIPPIITRKSLIYDLRSLIIAYDRMILLKNARKLADRGTLIISDRYPDPVAGGIDGPELRSIQEGGWLNSKCVWLEEWLYKRVPKPDIVIRLYVPLGIAIERNKQRAQREKDSENYLRSQYMSNQSYISGSKATIDFRTDTSLQVTQQGLLRGLWSAICISSPV